MMVASITQEIFLELDETKAEPHNIYQSFQKSEEETEGGPQAGHTIGRHGQPLARAPYG
jgi:hypothetical protein